MTFNFMKKSRCALIWMAGAALLTAGGVGAEDFFDIPAADLPSSATLAGGGDALGSRDVTFQMDFGVPSGTRIRGGYSSARIDSDSINYLAQSYWAGLNSDPLAPFSYGANYEIKKRDDGIRSSAAKANLRWQLNRWRLAVYPEFRWLTLKKTFVTQNNKMRSAEVAVRSPGVGAAVTYTGLARWSFALRHFVYRYEADVQILRSNRVSTRPIASRIDYSFDTSRSGVSVDYLPSWGSVGVDATHNESAIDNGFAQSAAVNLSWDVSRAWSVFASAGHSRGKDIAASNFASAGATWTWDD